MSKKKTLFISDIHLGAGNSWDWFSINKESDFLINFFQYVIDRKQKDDDIKELVLLGDIFDLWVCPFDEKPHTFEQVIKAQSKVINKIKEVADNVKTIYVNGNHDFRVSNQNILDVFEGKVVHFGNNYRRGNILAEHGHSHALFNRPDPINDPVLRLPLGYYITRLHTTLNITKLDKTKMIMPVFNELLQLLGPEKLPETVIDIMKKAVEEQIYPKKVETFSMGQICEDQKLENVRSRYQNLFNDWKNSVGYWKSMQMIMCEINRLGGVADQLCEDGVDIVIFGHSHDTKMDKDSWLVKNRIYANCGYWCGFGEKEKANDNAHFVETDGRGVSLFSFKDGVASLKEELYL